jgi:sugar lactone lactonase YvrE
VSAATTRTAGRWLAIGCLLLSGACSTPQRGPTLGQDTHTYRWASDWLQLPGGQDLGNTHGEIVVDRDGNLHLNTDTEQAIMTFAPDGSFVSAWGSEFANGVHGMQLVEEDGTEYLYFVHFNRHEFVKATLDGHVLWRQGYPETSGKYESAEQFRPTSIAVAPDGRLFVADGYGQGWVHLYDADRNYLRSIGGPGSDPGKFQTPHGVWIDTRGDEPELLVADRENHRLQRFDLNGRFLGIIEGMLRRPCKIQEQGGYLVVPDLAGRVTVLGPDNQLVTQLGDNPDPALRARNDVPKESWRDGEFLSPHSAAWDSSGNLYVMDWNRWGRISKLRRVRP